ncbi:hypothetical protein D9M69_585660 [compost metagenome]
MPSDEAVPAWSTAARSQMPKRVRVTVKAASTATAMPTPITSSRCAGKVRKPKSTEPDSEGGNWIICTWGPTSALVDAISTKVKPIVKSTWSSSLRWYRWRRMTASRMAPSSPVASTASGTAIQKLHWSSRVSKAAQ